MNHRDTVITEDIHQIIKVGNSDLRMTFKKNSSFEKIL